MKIAVCVKQAVEIGQYVEFTPDGEDVDPAFVTREINEADTYAPEEALRLRDAAGAGEVIALTAGEDAADEVLRQCLARGADRAVRVNVAGAVRHDPIAVGRQLASAIRHHAPELILCGVQSSDAAQQSTGPALASALGLPCVCVAVQLSVADDKKTLIVQREFEGGLRELVEVALPAVVTIQTGLNAPRYGSFKGMMRAKKTAIDIHDPGQVAASRATLRRILVPEAPSNRAVNIIDGGPADVAARIVELVREAQA